jgi:hypothetical protein
MRKEPDGSVEADKLADVDESHVGEPGGLEADLTMLLVEEDVETIGKGLKPGSVAAVVVYENSWTGPSASSIRRPGGQLVASARIPTQALLAAIDAGRTRRRGRSLTCRWLETSGSTGRARRTEHANGSGCRNRGGCQARSRPAPARGPHRGLPTDEHHSDIKGATARGGA